jgi:hypothetical protein
MKTFLKSVLYIATLVATVNAFAGHGWNRVNYTNSTIFTGVVTVDGIPAESGDVIGIFVKGECRMVSTVFVQNGNAYVSAVLHGEKIDTATIKYWSAKQDKIYDVDTTIATSPSNEILLLPIRIKSEVTTTENKIVPATNTVTIYPTIAKSNISIISSIDVNAVTIINNIGNIVLSINEPITNKIDISSLATGIYFVSVSTKNGSTITKKIIKN